MDAPSFRRTIASDTPQARAYDEFFAEGGRMPLWRHWGQVGRGAYGGRYSCLIAESRVPAALESFSWDARLDALRPGFSESYAEGVRTVSYERLGADGVEALVHVRFRLEQFPHDFLIPEEFVLLFDLRRNEDGNWYRIDDAGVDHVAIEISRDAVFADWGLIRRYQAARQMCAELMIDSEVWDEALQQLGEVRIEQQTADSALSYVRVPLEGRSTWISRLVGKRILRPPAIGDCGLWPYEHSDGYETFVIGVDDVGKQIEYSADPDGLANYFGANPNAPNYVTPVAFSKDVLEKYYRSPDKYSVGDGYLRRGDFWSIRIDNEHPRYVTVMLGDLGRDLPFAEQKYWKSFNLVQPGTFSETAVRRGFLGQFADAAAPDLQFRRIYRETNNAWHSRFGWELFVPLEGDDAHLLDQVRVLPNDEQHSFDEQVLGMTKLLVDSLNERALAAAVGSIGDDEKGISKLARFLAVNSFTNTAGVTDGLRELQAIRSSGAAHRKGRQFEKLRAAAPSTDRRLWWADLLERSIKALEDLRAFALARL